MENDEVVEPFIPHSSAVESMQGRTESGAALRPRDNAATSPADDGP